MDGEPQRKYYLPYKSPVKALKIWHIFKKRRCADNSFNFLTQSIK